MVWVVALSTTDVITRSLSPVLILVGIRSLIGVGNRVWPLAHSVLYLQESARDAIPKYISERTSYHGV